MHLQEYYDDCCMHTCTCIYMYAYWRECKVQPLLHLCYFLLVNGQISLCTAWVQSITQAQHVHVQVYGCALTTESGRCFRDHGVSESSSGLPASSAEVLFYKWYIHRQTILLQHPHLYNYTMEDMRNEYMYMYVELWRENRFIRKPQLIRCTWATSKEGTTCSCNYWASKTSPVELNTLVCLSVMLRLRHAPPCACSLWPAGSNRSTRPIMLCILHLPTCAQT